MNKEKEVKVNRNITLLLQGNADIRRENRALSVSELHYRRIFETARDGIIILDAETGMIVDVNSFLIEILGYSKEQLIKKNIWEIGLFKDVISNRNNFLILQQKEYIRFEDLPLQTADRRLIEVEFISSVYLEGKKKIIQCNIRDNTNHNQMRVLLRDIEERYKILTQTSMDGFMVIDTKGRIIEVNDAYCEISGYSKDALYSMNISDLEYYESAKQTKERIEKIMMSGRDRFDSKHRKANGKAIDVESNVTFLPNKGIFLCFICDITERKKKEEEIRYNSFHDQLTGLYNRRFYEEELKRLDTERNLPISIIMGDVNGLKLVNDSFGHVMGDNILKKAAEVLKKGCRADEIIARLGGDEFIILLPKTSAVKTEEMINRIKNLILKEKAGPCDISMSFGFETKKSMKENMQEIFKNTEDHMYRHKLSESSSARNRTVNLILNTLFEKSNREMLHSKRVSELCVDIATKLNFDMDSINQIRTAGLMHDIGKIGVSEEILNKPQKLNINERNEIERHSEIGYQILSSVNDFSEIAKFVLEHHERWDGKGYPKGLKGEEISLQARIIAIADSFDAMTSERSYRKEFNKEEALNEIRRCSGTQFDPDIARLFVEIEEGAINYV